jgi:hypothetical protein
LFSRRIRNPRNSRPIKISHEPGEKGVTSARNPRTIRITPTIVLAVLLIIRATSSLRAAKPDGLGTSLFVEPSAASS